MAQASLPAQTLQGLPQQALNGLVGLWWPLEADPCQPHLLPPSPSAHLAPATGSSCFLNTLSTLPASGPLHMLAPLLGLLLPLMVARPGIYHLKCHLLSEGLPDHPTQAAPVAPSTAWLILFVTLTAVWNSLFTSESFPVSFTTVFPLPQTVLGMAQKSKKYLLSE